MPASWDGFDDFYSRTMPKTFRALLAITGHRESAEDATQEAFMLAYEHWANLQNPPAWVWKVALNYLRKRWKYQNHEVLESSLAGRFEITAEALAMAAPAAARADLDLIKAFADLPPMQQAVMVGRYILDLRPIDVAEAIGISRQTESEHHRRALLTLSKRLANWRTNE